MAISFKQSDFLQTYIDLNSNLRAQAKTKFEERQLKTFNNCVYGKFIENLRKRRDIKLVSLWEGRYGARKLLSSLKLKSFKVIGPSLMVIELKKDIIYYNRPIYIGSAILDISKTVVYDFHYGYAKTVFKDNLSLCYHDTDSLVYEIRNQDVYDIIKRDIHKFDTSGYDPNNIFGIPLCNKKIVGLMSDENNGKVMTKFVGLKAKMYSFILENEEEVKKAKGVKKNVVNKISFNDYKNCLFNEERIHKKQCTIRARNYNLYSIEQNKLTLDNKDDKRHILENNIDTIALGHFSLRECITID